jgi:hypothetical protein
VATQTNLRILRSIKVIGEMSHAEPAAGSDVLVVDCVANIDGHPVEGTSI